MKVIFGPLFLMCTKHSMLNVSHPRSTIHVCALQLKYRGCNRMGTKGFEIARLKSSQGFSTREDSLAVSRKREMESKAAAFKSVTFDCGERNLEILPATSSSDLHQHDL